MKGDNIADRLEALGADIVALVRELPQDRVGKHVADQLLRAGTSGGSNYEEARSAESKRDFIHKLSIAAKEMRESRYWLGLVSRTEDDLRARALELREEATELVAILMKSRATARASR